MSRKSKMENTGKLINIVGTLLSRQEILLQHIVELEEYIAVLENNNDYADSDEIIVEFTAGEEWGNIKEVLENGLTDEQKVRLEEIKNQKQITKDNLHSMEDILKVLEEPKEE